MKIMILDASKVIPNYTFLLIKRKKQRNYEIITATGEYNINRDNNYKHIKEYFDIFEL